MKRIVVLLTVVALMMAISVVPALAQVDNPSGEAIQLPPQSCEQGQGDDNSPVVRGFVDPETGEARRCDVAPSLAPTP